MKRFVAVGAVTLAALVGGSQAYAASTEGTVAAYDRVAHVIVMDDRSIYSLSATETNIPETLTAGDRVKIDFVSPGEDGISKILSVTILDDVE